MKAANDPLIKASINIARLHFPPEDLSEVLGNIAADLGSQVDKTTRLNDNSPVEQTLIAQATTLDSVIHQLLSQMTAGLSQPSLLAERFEMITGLAAIALKVQDQSRKTLATLNEIRNPRKPAQFIKHYVNQQMNELRVEQGEIKQQLESSNYTPLNIRGPR